MAAETGRQSWCKRRMGMNECIASHRWMYLFVDVFYFDALVFPAMCHGGIVGQLCEQPQMEEQYSAPSQWNIADGQSPRNC